MKPVVGEQHGQRHDLHHQKNNENRIASKK
jgi:hypothetical protein